MIQVENELKTSNSEKPWRKSFLHLMQIFEKLNSAAKTMSDEWRCKMVVVEMDALKWKCDEKEDLLVLLRKKAKELFCFFTTSFLCCSNV